MGIHYDDKIKYEVLDAYKKGLFGGRKCTAEHFNIPEGTLCVWIRKDKKTMQSR